MKDKIEIGESVRTKKGVIGILKAQYTFENGGANYPEPQEWVLDVNGNEYIANEADYENIVKHSKNIKKLIDVGDIVEVLLKKITGATTLIKIEDNEELKTLKDLHKKYIKSIVTKEQFENMKYEVKDE